MCNKILNFINDREDSIHSLASSQVESSRVGVLGFAQRHLVSRVVAVVAHTFSFLLLIPKVAGGLLALGEGVCHGLATREWTRGLFHPAYAKKYFNGVLFSCTSPIRLLVALVAPSAFGKRVNSSQPAREELSMDHQAIAQKHLDTMSKEELDKNWKLNEFFGSIFYINLDKSTERRTSITQELTSIGLQEGDYQRFSACNGRTSLPKQCWDRVDSNYKRIPTHTREGRERLDRQHQGQAGCYMSHYSIIRDVASKYSLALATLEKLEKDPNSSALEKEQAKNAVKHYSSVLIIEDDAHFGTIQKRTCNDGSVHRYFSNELVKTGSGTTLREAMKALPKDWDMLYFMALSYVPPLATASASLTKLYSGTCLTAYAVHASMYPALLEKLNKIDGTGSFKPVDDAIASIQPSHNCYVINPPIAAQSGEGSDINGVTQSDNPDKKYWQCGWPPQ